MRCTDEDGALPKFGFGSSATFGVVPNLYFAGSHHGHVDELSGRRFVHIGVADEQTAVRPHKQIRSGEVLHIVSLAQHLFDEIRARVVPAVHVVRFAERPDMLVPCRFGKVGPRSNRFREQRRDSRATGCCFLQPE